MKEMAGIPEKERRQNLQKLYFIVVVCIRKTHIYFLFIFHLYIVHSVLLILFVCLLPQEVFTKKKKSRTRSKYGEREKNSTIIELDAHMAKQVSLHLLLSCACLHRVEKRIRWSSRHVFNSDAPDHKREKIIRNESKHGETVISLDVSKKKWIGKTVYGIVLPNYCDIDSMFLSAVMMCRSMGHSILTLILFVKPRSTRRARMHFLFGSRRIVSSFEFFLFLRV
eukprot:gene4458-3253_t